MYLSGTNTLGFATNGTLDMVLDANGTLGIGTTTLTGFSLVVGKNITGSVAGFGIASNGTIQSDVLTGRYFYSLASTQATTFTAQIFHYQAAQGTFGAGSTVSTQVGFNVTSNLIGATNNYGFYGDIPAGTNRFNLYMNGTANNYLAGSLGIGTTSLTGINFYINKNITGSTNGGNLYSTGTIQSDMTGNVNMVYSAAAIAAGAFTVSNLWHYNSDQLSIGAGAAITTQVGFRANNTLVGAGTNYGFQGRIPAQANAWNLYMDGTANNYLAGNLGIGSASIDTTMLRISRSFTSTLTASIFLDSQVSSTNASAIYIATSANTQAATFTTQIRHINIQQGTFGAGSTVTNQFGVIVGASMVGGTSNFGFFGDIPSGTNRWNLYMNGTANNYMAGSLGIGTTSLTGYTLRLSKSITGSTASFAARNEGVVQSDVTADAIGFRNDSNTAAAAFTLTNYWHFWARQGSIGAGSTITNQYGYVVDSNMIGATNNYAFQGNIPSGTNRWNLYMAGTAANYMAGKLNIGTTSIDTTTRLHLLDSTNGYVGLRLEGSGQYAGSDWTLYASSSPLSSSNDFFGIYNNSNTDSATIGYKLIVTKQGTAALGTSTPNASAILQTDSTTRGFLPPRMTTTQKLAIGTPAAGLMVYDTTLNQMSYYNGTLWINF
jgi:hypothetical protein